MNLFIITLSVFGFQIVQSARILGFFPVPSISHQVVFRALTQELTRRGHELVIVTPNPISSQNKSIPQLREIDISDSYKILHEAYEENIGFRGTPGAVNRQMVEGYSGMGEFALKNEEFRKIMNDKNERFDLVLLEAFFTYASLFKHTFNAPVILISSFGAQQQLYELFGSPSAHPILYPDIFSYRFFNLSLMEKVKQIYMQLKLRYYFDYVASDIGENIAQEYFGKSFKEAKDCVDLIFLNMHPIFEGNIPVAPNVIHLGAFHLQPVEDLPKDLKTILDNSTTGVIFVSLGTNVRPSLMDSEFLNAFTSAFAKLPYDIMWKLDDDDLKDKPANVLVRKWFPQRSLLHHPNIKAFVTQGGLQSTDEAIDAAVPLVGIPLLGDQWFNVENYVRLGIGVKLDSLTMTAEDLIQGVKKVIDDKSYKESIVKLRTLVQDQPQTPLERAVWWTEYVIRHRGAKHLRANTFNMSWTEYLMIDVLLLLGSLALVVFIISSVIWRTIRRELFKKSKLKTS